MFASLCSYLSIRRRHAPIRRLFLVMRPTLSTSGTHVITPVDREVLSRDVAGCGGEKKQHRPRSLVRSAPASQGDLRQVSIPKLLAADSFGHRGFHHTI